jgi:secreted protein with Ig-like and vWFA domain
MIFSGSIFGRWLPDAISKWQSLHKDDSNDLVAFLCTAYGLAALGYGIYLDSTEKLKPGFAIANILLPLPSLFAWLTLSPIRLNVDLAPFAIGGNLLFDAVGYVGGGLELLLDTVQNKDKLNVAEA